MRPARGHARREPRYPCLISMARELHANLRLTRCSRAVHHPSHTAVVTVQRLAVRGTCCCRVQALWQSYFEAMSSVGFRDDRPLYLASGLTTYLNASGGHQPAHRPHGREASTPLPARLAVLVCFASLR